MNSITDVVMVLDPAGHLLRFNRAGLEMQSLYVSSADLYRSPAEGVFVERMSDVNGCPLPLEQYPSSRVLRGEVLSGVNSVDVLIRTLVGESRYLNVSGAPLCDAAGKQVDAVMVGRDVTERRQLERRTQQALNALIQMAHALVMVPAEQPSLLDVIPPRLAEFTRDVLGQERVTLVSMDPETNTLHPLVAMGLTPEQETSGALPSKAHVRARRLGQR